MTISLGVYSSPTPTSLWKIQSKQLKYGPLHSCDYILHACRLSENQSNQVDQLQDNVSNATKGVG